MDGDAKDPLSNGIHAIKYGLHAELFRINAALFVQHRVAQEPCGHDLVLRRVRQHVTRDLLKDEHMDVIACESAEAAELVIEELGESLRLLVTDVELAGSETGIELAGAAKRHFPALKVVIVSGQDHLPLPPDVHFLKKPWRPLELLREAMG